MSSTLNFLQSEYVLALIAVLLIFLTIFFGIVKRWVSFAATLLLLLFSLAGGFIVNNQQEFQYYLSSPSYTVSEEISAEDFQKQMLQAMTDLQKEVAVEKENLRHVMEQVQNVFDSVDIQKQKLQNFIEEVRQHFKNDHPLNLETAVEDDNLTQSFE